MSWQDAVIGAGQLIFALALLPSVLGDEKPAPATSLVTAFVLSLFVPTFWSLGLVWAAGCGTIAAVLWWALLVQGLQQRRQRRRRGVKRLAFHCGYCQARRPPNSPACSCGSVLMYAKEEE